MNIHVRMNGISDTFNFSRLGIFQASTDREIRESLARYFNREFSAFDEMVIERHANGNITVRPEAIFG